MKKFLLTIALFFLLVAPTQAGLIFDGTNDNVHYGDIPAIDDATTLSCSIWVYLDNLTADYALFNSQVGGVAGITWIYDLKGATSGADRIYTIFIKESAGGGSSDTKIEGQTDSASATTWQHVFFSFLANTASTGMQLWVDGAETTNGSPTGTSSVAQVGAGGANMTFGETVAGTNDLPGRLAEAACWDVILIDPEIISLSKDLSPIHVRPASLVFYVPMVGKTKSDNDIIGGKTPTYANDTASTPHPRVYK